MKKTLLVALTPFALLGTSAAFADTTNCATKIRAIETQIEMAKQYGNTFRVAGLQDALASTKANCTNAGQAEHAERKVREAERDASPRRRNDWPRSRTNCARSRKTYAVRKRI